jgi:hypothetical protein
MSKSDQKNPLDHIRPSFIPLSEIHGVDIENNEYTPHPDFPNPKFELRADVLESLSTAKSPSEIPPIEVFLHTDGQIVCLDGAHRIINQIRKCGGDPGAAWNKIRVTRYIPDSSSKNAVLDAQIRSNTHNLEFLRGDLTEGEEVGVVQRLMDLGLDKKEIVERTGKGSTRWINKIELIINATPAVLEAVKKGEISLETGSKIAKFVPVAQQSDKVEQAAELEQTKGGVQARVDLGVRKDRIKVASTKDMFKRLWSIFEEVEADYGITTKTGASKLDPMTEGEWNILMFYFGYEKDDHDEVIAKLRPEFDEYMERENNPKPKKGKKAA